MRHSLILSCPPDTKNGEIGISKCLKRLMKSIRFSFLNVLGLFFLSVGIG